jgi:hypothetical protein
MKRVEMVERLPARFLKNIALVLLVFVYMREQQDEESIDPARFERMLLEVKRVLEAGEIKIEYLSKILTWRFGPDLAVEKQLLTIREGWYRYEYGFCKWAREFAETHLNSYEIFSIDEVAKETYPFYKGK